MVGKVQIYKQLPEEPRTAGLKKVTAFEIRKMAKEAIENPEERARLLECLEEIAAEGPKKESGIATKAIATILTVQMLEMLKQ
ncbi:MAG: hypothetical protein QXT43_00980 [Candidatus Micrarchaeaceae archaeon]